jgi:hypothetical protein
LNETERKRKKLLGLSFCALWPASRASGNCIFPERIIEHVCCFSSSQFSFFFAFGTLDWCDLLFEWSGEIFHRAFIWKSILRPFCVVSKKELFTISSFQSASFGTREQLFLRFSGAFCHVSKFVPSRPL